MKNRLAFLVQAAALAFAMLSAPYTWSSPQAADDAVAAGAGAPRPPLRLVPGLDEPLVAARPTVAKEDRALDRALAAYSAAPVEADIAARGQPLIAFLSDHPDSAWRASLLTNLGIAYYRDGYFSKAFSAWREAWSAGKSAQSVEAKALTSRAVGELARMHARVGHAQELEQLFAELGDQPISGSATEMITGAKEGLWMFRNDPGLSFLCGPMALKNLMVALNAPGDKIEPLRDERSGPNGYSLLQVSALAQRLGVEHRLVHRAPGQPVPVPSIVNWKVSHFAAIVDFRDGRYRIKDPTFASGDLWITERAIDEESSGFFLVPQVALPQGDWRVATVDEARAVYGMGFTSQNQPGATKPNDKGLGCSGGNGMCVVDAKLMVVSLALKDAPMGYRPQRGPAVQIRLTYNQREAGQQAVMPFGNVSPKWTHNMLSYVQDNVSLSPGSLVSRYVAGGGYIDYSSTYAFNAATGAFSPERQGQAVLVRIPASGAATSYELRMPDGSKDVFARSDGATSGLRKMFLTQRIDAQGNTLTLSYDAQLRLASITDATGRNTIFTYANANPLLITRVTDPFGRFATLNYDASGRLSSITDVLGLSSSFGYDASGLVNSMTTPYGTSSFSYGSSGTTRFLNMTDPLNLTERVEFVHQAPGMTYADPVAPPGVNNDYLYFRNTFHWDKHAYAIAPTDYTKARITHWLHDPQNQTSPVVESTKLPLERRLWYRYPNPLNGVGWYEGSGDTPSLITRLLDDGTPQASQFTYNSIGKPLTAIDPAGRKTVFTYDATGIDLLQVQRQTSASGTLSTLATFTYNTQHLPLTYTDAAGQTTTFTYNAAGQLSSVKNALNQTTTYNSRAWAA
jgi:YD repeat-containing protein